MKFLVIVAFIATCQAAPSIIGLHHPTLYSSYLPAAVPVGPAISQYHAQDELGQYSYGYAGGPSSKSEIKTLDGVTRGSYSYIDANSKLQTVEYVSDALGFRVAATNLPTAPVDTNVAPVDTNEAPAPVEDTPEVAEARKAHLEAVEKVKNGEVELPQVPEVAPLEAPKPVEDTAEVASAKAAHLEAVEVAKARNALAEEEQIVVSNIVSAPLAHAQLIHAPVAIHSAHSAALQYRAAPIIHSAPLHYNAAPVLLRAQPASNFAYSVYSGYHGYPQLIAA